MTSTEDCKESSWGGGPIQINHLGSFSDGTYIAKQKIEGRKRINEVCFPSYQLDMQNDQFQIQQQEPSAGGACITSLTFDENDLDVPNKDQKCLDPKSKPHITIQNGVITSFGCSQGK